MRVSGSILVVLLAAAGSSCLATEGATTGHAAASRSSSAGRVGEETAGAGGDAVPASHSGGSTRKGVAAASAMRGRERSKPRLDPDQLSLWRSPDFQRRFTESYLADTDTEPRVTGVERERMQEVLELISGDQMGKAERLLVEQVGPDANAVFDFTLANIRYQEDRLEEAARGYRAAVEKYSKFMRAWKNLGLIRVRRGEFEEARRSLTRVIELGGGDAIAYGLLGFSCSNLENHLAAESAYRMATLLDPERLDWKMGLARSFFEQRRYADAASLCGTLIEEDPDRAELWLLQANAYIGLDEPLEAAENYELVDSLGRSTADSLDMLGDIYVNEELFGLAVDSYARAMEKEEATPDRAVRAAKVLAARSAFDETKELVGRIDEAFGEELEDGQRKDLLKLRARIAVAEGAGEEEARVLEEIVRIDPLDGEALILLGQHNRRAGDLEEAIFYFERAASLEGFEARAKVRHAQLLVSEGRYAEALPLLRRAQEVDPRENVQQYLEQVERIHKRG